MADANYTEPVTYRDRKEVVDILVRIADKEGHPTGAFARELVRKGLHSHDDLTEQERKALGVNGQATRWNSKSTMQIRPVSSGRFSFVTPLLGTSNYMCS